MSKVVEIKGLHEKRNEQLAKMLEDFVVLARKGELSNVVVIAQVRGFDQVEFDWDTDDRLSLVGSLEMVKAEILDSLFEERDGDPDDDGINDDTDIDGQEDE